MSARKRPDRAKRALPQWELDGAITVVLFAGLGGACEGLEDAGCPVHVANNHDPVALAAHVENHPHTRHVKGDIFDVDPVVATSGQPVKILWASPDCRDHSVAKGGAPRSARVRSLPWQVCRWIGKMRPRLVMMENVREIRGWGPLVAKRDRSTGRVLKLDGTVAARGEHVPLRDQQLVRDRTRQGRSFRRFVGHVRRLGYAYEDRDLCCADFGVPTSRRRWFAVARCDGAPIGWPERSHAPADQAQQLGLQPWVGAHTIIDWSVPMASIFGRKKPLAPATERRIAVGLQRYVLDNPRPFIVPITHTGTPRVHGLDEPLRTVTTAHRGELALVAPAIMANNHQNVGVDITSPVPTLTTGNRNFVTAACLSQFYGEKADGAARAADVEAPLPTLSTSNRFGVATGKLAAFASEQRGNSIGQDLSQPLGTQTQVVHHALVGAWMAQHNFTADQVVGKDLTAPLSTVVAKAGPQAVVAASLVKLRGTSTAQDAEDPIPTLSAGGNHVGCVAAFLSKYYGQGGVAQAADDPLHALSTRMRFGVVTTSIGGTPYVVTDIAMRMLEPHEAAAAHELRLPAAITVDGVRQRLTKTDAMRLVGNSVPKRLPMLIAQANHVHALDQMPVRQAAE